MLGNCAIGRPAIVTAPTITVTIAITMATIGRLMKNLDMIQLPAGEAAAAVLARPKDILGIRKQSGQTNGARLHINLTVGSKEFPLSRVCRSVSQNKVQHELSYSLLSRRHRRIALNEGEVLLLTYNEIGFDWIEL